MTFIIFLPIHLNLKSKITWNSVSLLVLLQKTSKYAWANFCNFPSCLKNDAFFISGQNWLENNNLPLWLWVNLWQILYKLFHLLESLIHWRPDLVKEEVHSPWLHSSQWSFRWKRREEQLTNGFETGVKTRSFFCMKEVMNCFFDLLFIMIHCNPLCHVLPLLHRRDEVFAIRMVRNSQF